MASDSEVSSHTSDGGDDSDTIVISSKSRILISPRKKGSKAVSKLLGSAAAADDIVESILRGSGGTDVHVVRKAKKATVTVSGSNTDTTSIAQHHTESQTPTSTTNANITARGNQSSTKRTRHEQSVDQEGRRRRVDTTVQRQEDHNSDDSDVDSELSAPSSAEEEVDTRPPQRVSRRVDSSSTRVHTTQRSRHAVYESESDDDESDTSSLTRDSPRSEDQTPVSTGRQRKFDDQLRTSAHSGTGQAQHSSRVSRSTHTGSSKSKARFEHNNASASLDDSVLLPKTATQEMEDLKQTLKNLAHQDPAISSSSTATTSTFMLSNEPKKAHVRPKISTHKLRREEYAAPAMTSRHTEDAWAVTSSHKRLEKKTTDLNYHQTAATRLKTSSRPVRHSDEESESDEDHGEPTVARRLFSTPPPKQAKPTAFSTPPTVPLSSKQTPSPLSTSFQSNHGGYTSVLDTSLSTAAASSAQGSRAVLSALKALQDKIRRLEEERERLLQELSDAKVKARKREAEFASAEKKFAYELGQSKESARAAYDALRSEKEELKLELVKYEERRKAAEAEIQHAHRLTSTYSAKADDLQSQLQLSESQRKSIHAELEATCNAHKQEIRDLKGEIVSLQKDRGMAQEQTKLVQSQLDREMQTHNETRERLHEAEQTVGGITQLNEKLVAKVWEANEIATKATKKSKKLLQSQRVSTLSRPTAASRAASICVANGNATPARPGSANVPKGRAGSVTAKRSGSITNKEKRPSQAHPSNNLELLRAANLGRDIPFVLGTSANRSHSIISNVQEAIRQCDTSYARPGTNPPPTPTPTQLKVKKTTKKTASVRGNSTVPTSSAASILGLALNAHTTDTLLGARSRSREDSVASKVPSNRPSAIRVLAPSTSYPNPMQSHIMEDLDEAVCNAEREFNTLNQRYKDAVTRVEQGKDGASRLSLELGSMLDELEAKGRQLNLLKQVYEQASRSTINPNRHVVHSPEAVRRKTASLRILNDYRQMERDAKSPRSAVSPSGTHTTSHQASFFSDNA